MNKLISFAALISLCFLLSNCQKKEETPIPSLPDEVSTLSSNRFIINGDGNSNHLVVIDTAFQQDFNSEGSRYIQVDSLLLSVKGSGVIGGQTKNIGIWLHTHYAGLGTYPIGNTVQDATRMTISVYNNLNDAEKYYTCQSGTLIITGIDNGYFIATYSGVFIVNDDPNTTVTITDGVMVCPFETIG